MAPEDGQEHPQEGGMKAKGAKKGYLLSAGKTGFRETANTPSTQNC